MLFFTPGGGQVLSKDYALNWLPAKYKLLAKNAIKSRKYSIFVEEKQLTHL